MRAIPQHPGREWIKCQRCPSGVFYPRAAGCPVCRAARQAEQLATEKRTIDGIGQLLDEHDRRHQVDNGQAATVGLPGSAPSGPRTQPSGAACPASIAELIDRESALLERAKQRAQQTIAGIERALSDDEQRRKKTHEAAALEEIRRGLFEALTGRVVNSAFELELVRP